MAAYGFVYCLSNSAFPGMYKVGFTRNSPSLRAKQLSSTTGVPVEFEVDWYVESQEADHLEKKLHAEFSGSRVSMGREFFKACSLEMYDYICEDQLTAWTRPDLMSLVVKRNMVK